VIGCQSRFRYAEAQVAGGRTIGAATLVILGGIAAVAQTPAPTSWTAGEPVTLFDGGTFSGWCLERIDLTGPLRECHNFWKPPIEEDSARLSPMPGWLRTKESFDDFRLTLSYRAAHGVHGGLYFRTWRRLDTTGVPANGYEIVLGTGPGMRLHGRVIGHGQKGRIAFDENRSRALSDEWHTLTVECRDDRAEVSIDDLLTTVVTGIENRAGFVGLRSEAGTIDVRKIVLRPLWRQRTEVSPIRRYADGMGITRPRVVREVKPVYTPEAMEAKLEGEVLLEIVVKEDGTVGDVEIVRRLAPELDEQAVRAARGWRFTPALRDGKPVPVRVTLELTFTLR
jgi:TonB family protein